MLNQFTTYLSDIRGMSENTIKCYRKDLQHFIKWAKANITDARWSTITRDDIDRYIISQCDEGLTPSTTNRRLSAISSFYNYLRRQGYVKSNPCKYESRRKVAARIPNTIPVNQLHTAYTHAEGVAKVMLGILATTGIRLQELLNLTWSDVDFESNSLRICGKGDVERKVYTLPEMLYTLRLVRDATYPTGLIFTIDQRTARNMIWRALRPFSDAPQLSPHAIRHTLATNMALMGANVSTIGAILGHKHLETTQKYIDMTQAPVREACHLYKLFT